MQNFYLVFDATPYDEGGDQFPYLQVGIAKRNPENLIGYQQYQKGSVAYSPADGDSSYKIEETVDDWPYREILPSQRGSTTFYILLIAVTALVCLIVLPICVFFIKSKNEENGRLGSNVSGIDKNEENEELNAKMDINWE